LRVPVQSPNIDGETGADTVRFRHYDPTPGVARWLERDPAGYVDGPSLYGYLGRSPVAGSDPFGLGFWSWVGSTVVGAGSGAISGAITGAIVGFVVGGPGGAAAGALSGAVAGAVWGGISASFTDAADQLGGGPGLAPLEAAGIGGVAGAIAGPLAALARFAQAFHYTSQAAAASIRGKRMIDATTRIAGFGPRVVYGTILPPWVADRFPFLFRLLTGIGPGPYVAIPLPTDAPVHYLWPFSRIVFGPVPVAAATGTGSFLFDAKLAPAERIPGSSEAICSQ
jgi:RHS repeat-associated protein